MHKPLHSLSGKFTFICFLLLAKLSLAQTLPTPQALPYSQNFGTAAFSAMPAGTNSFTRNNATTITTQAAAETATPLANAIVAPLTGNIPNNLGAGTHGYSQNGTNAQVVIQTSANGNNDAANSVIIALNTAGWINIVLSYQLTILAGTNASGVVTQYRIGATGSWVTLTGPGNPTLGNSSSTPTNLSFALPAACNNQPTVYIRWSPWNGVGNNNINARFRFALDNIAASGTVLPPQPGGVYGANLWLKGNTGTTPVSGTLSNWVDQTGTNTFTVSGTPQTGVTANQINFNNAVGFNGTNAYLTGNTNITFQTLYAVIKRDNASFNSTVISATTPTNENLGYMMKGDKMATGNNLSGSNSTLYFQSPGTLGTVKPRLGVLEIVNDQGANNSRSYIDGLFAFTQYFSGGGSQMKTFSAIPYIGRSQNIADPGYFNGKIAELVMYPASHTSDERLKIESYLAVKYGITLDPILSSYRSSSNVNIWNNTTYWNDVFGIGRDDASTLNQTQSNSVNTGSGNGIGQPGKANIAISSTAALANGQYLMIGHNAGALTDNARNMPPNLVFGNFTRLVREWKVSNINGVGTVNLVFDTTGLVLSGKFSPVLADYYLAVDTDGDGSYNTGSAAIPASAFTTNGVAFNNVTLPNNAGFTLAVKLVNPLNKWTGGLSTLWNNNTNWSLFRKPLSTDSVVIDKVYYDGFTGTPPTLNEQFTVGYRLQFVNNPDFTIAPGGMLSVSAGGVADVTTTVLKNILSDSTGSGLIGQVNGTIVDGNTTGNSWVVERWFGARRSFRYVTPPVVPVASFVNTIRIFWMGGDALGAAYNYPYALGSPQYTQKGYYTNISGGITGGFDQTQTNNPSLWTWNPANQTWNAVTSTGITPVFSEGYRLVVRGDRGTNLDQNRPPASETRIKFAGNLLNSDYIVPAARIAPQDTGYSMIANPYQSMVDATKITRTGMTNYMYIWDARIIGTKGFGAFVTVDLVNNTNNMGNFNPDYNSQADKWIQPAQAVFFQNNPASTGPRAVTFVQSAKGGPAERRRIFGSDPVPNPTDIVSNINLWSTSEEFNLAVPVDGLTIRFGDQYTTAADYEDGSKLNNTDESISVWNNGRSVSIDKRKMPAADEVIQLLMTRMRVANYKWMIDGMDLSPVGLQAYLKDAYLNTETLIPLNGPNEFPFTVNPNVAESVAADRFSIVFRTSTILPITFVKLETEQQGQQFNLLWTSSSNKVGNIFEVQRSATGNQFDKMASLPVNSNASNKYNWLDATPEKGNNFYRIKLTEPDGNIIYSNIARVNLGAKGRGFDVYPNPVKGQSFTVYLNDLPAGQYQVSLVNSSGQRLIQTVLQHNGGNASRQLNIGKELPYGSYQVILQQDDQQYTRKIIIE